MFWFEPDLLVDFADKLLAVVVDRLSYTLRGYQRSGPSDKAHELAHQRCQVVEPQSLGQSEWAATPADTNPNRHGCDVPVSFWSTRFVPVDGGAETKCPTESG
jgi:hypothetical protein